MGVVEEAPAVERGALVALSRREFGISEASLLLMGTYLASALLGALRQALLNRQFGADETAGAFYAAARLPDTLFTLVAGGALSSAFIPVLVATRRTEGEDAAWRLTSLVLNSVLLVLTLVVVAGEIVAPVVVREILVPGYSAEGQATATALTRIMLVQPIVLAIGSVVTALLNSRNRFLLPALGIASHNLGIIAGIGATMLWPGLGITGPACGVVAGSVLQVGLMLPGLWGDGPRYRPILDLADRRLHEVARLLVPNGLSLGVNYAGFLVEASFASRLAEERALPALHNAWLLAGLPVTLAGYAIGQAAFPRLAVHAAAGDLPRLRRTLLRALVTAVALSLPAVAALLLLGGPVIDLLFAHGRFDAEASRLTERALRVYALGLPAYVATEVSVRGLLALRDARTPLLTNLLQLVLRTVLIALLYEPVGLSGIPLAMVISAAVETGVLLTLTARRLGRSAAGAS